jgi:imidazole glycerol-phosphate synthase subunit HisH
MITIINYGCGNIKAIQNVFHKLSINSKVANNSEELNNAEKLILPGVGAFDFAMQKLIDSGMKDKISELVLVKNKPVLGICVGMQLMANSSEEGVLQGLGWVDANVKRFDEKKLNKLVNLPHMGWNDVLSTKASILFEDLDENAKFYFLHSYYLSSNNNKQIIAKSDYAGEFVCAVNNKNVYGVQFHPEKSHQFGIKLLENFAKLID